MRGSNPLVASNNIELDGEEELEEEKFYSHLNITVSSLRHAITSLAVMFNVLNVHCIISRHQVSIPRHKNGHCHQLTDTGIVWTVLYIHRAWNTSCPLAIFRPILPIWPDKSNLLGQIYCTFPMEKPLIVHSNVPALRKGRPISNCYFKLCIRM